MSATLSSLVGKASTVFNAVSQLFGGSGNVQLGTVTFGGMEVPETLKWGGTADIVKQRLPGGKVIMSGMGIDFHPISWGGVFEGFTAITRSRQLYTMMNAQVPVSLSWNDRSYKVMIHEYTPEDTKTNWIPYHITCEVLSDETLSSNPAAPSLLSQITGDIAGAIGITPAQLTAGVGTALTVAQSAATVVGAVTSGSGAALALAGALAGVTTAVNAATGLANSSMAGIVASAGAGVFPAGSAVAGLASLATATDAAGKLAALPIIGGLIGRAQTNLGNAST